VLYLAVISTNDEMVTRAIAESYNEVAKTLVCVCVCRLSVCCTYAVDVTSGDELFELDEFIESRSYVVCTVTPDTEFLLVGEPSGTRLFALRPTTPVTETDYQACNDREYMVSFPSDTQPSAIAVSSDSRIAFIGHALDCQLYVVDIDQSSDSFGEVSFTASYFPI
jgi:hypothetical protein